jgi:anti-sigma regulatory factor (Ser/Thr protein kinase)
MCSSTARAELELPLDETSAAHARRFLRQTGCTAHAGHVLEDAVLLVSELVTNSVRYGGPPVVVAVDCEETALSVRVRDGSPVLPEVESAPPSAERGRGLTLVDIVSADWGVERDADGKQVWFVLR